MIAPWYPWLAGVAMSPVIAEAIDSPCAKIAEMIQSGDKSPG